MSIPLPLTELQIQTLHAAVDRIIPAADAADGWPSGWEAGVGGYFAHLLTRETQFLFPYQQGLDALDGEARATEGAGFATLAPNRQDAVLARVEAGDMQTDWPLPAAMFFRLLVEQTLEGFYADPGNGGNKDSVAWQMIGFQVTA